MFWNKKRITLFSVMYLCVALLFLPISSGIPVANATDPPHDAHALPSICLDCHIEHSSPGLSLERLGGTANLCLSCHAVESSRGFGTWQSSDMAVPGEKGTSHRWDADADNPEYGAHTPLSTEMRDRLYEGKLTCVTCHNWHEASAPGGSIYAAPVEKTANGGGTGTITVEEPAPEASAKNYMIEIVDSSPAATFRVSNDNGISWFGWDGSSWSPGEPTGRPVGSNVLLNDGNNVSVIFTGSFATGDQFSFKVLRPFLISDNTASAMCIECHWSWVQSSSEQEGGGDGVKVFSHPVGEGLAKPYDMAAPLDANGADQSPGDGNRTNDLLLDADGKVQCMTCHQPHGADSNSLTEDER